MNGDLTKTDTIKGGSDGLSWKVDVKQETQYARMKPKKHVHPRRSRTSDAWDQDARENFDRNYGRVDWSA